MCENCKNNCDDKGKEVIFKNILVDSNYLFVDINNTTVIVKAGDEDITVEIWEKEGNGLGEIITSTWCLYNE